MALSGVVCSVGCGAGDVLTGGDLGQHFGQHGDAAYIDTEDLDCPDLQRLFADPAMDLR
jgi:hypothetical protein